jgi:AraC-like DNA-binding protein
MAELRDSVQRLTVVHDLQARGGRPDGLVASASVGAVNLVFVRYGTEVLVDAFPTRNRFTLAVPLGPMRVATKRVYRADALPAGFVLSEADHTLIHPDPSAGALVISTSMARLEEHLVGLSGRVPAQALRFLPPDGVASVAPPAMVESSWQLVCRTLSETAGASLNALVARKLEDVLLSGILLGLPHTRMGDLVDGVPHSAGAADRARSWLEEHYDEPVTITDMARAVGISVRHLQHLVLQRFGSTPTELLRDIRLAQAHRLLSEVVLNPPTVSEVAHGCGFAHLSRFALEYRKRFGERPSETRRRVHG